jgi:hypothetical protein
MIFDANTPGRILLALDGELIGCVIRADTEKGYVIKARWSEERRVFYGHETLHGKVAVIGDIDVDPKEIMLERMNKHREECGLGPYPEHHGSSPL